MTPAEFILTRGYCQYCKTDIDDNDRCGCKDETIWYLNQAVEILSTEMAEFIEFCDENYPGDPRAYSYSMREALEKVEVML